jgi:hypothetical protein
MPKKQENLAKFVKSNCLMLLLCTGLSPSAAACSKAFRLMFHWLLPRTKIVRSGMKRTAKNHLRSSFLAFSMLQPTRCVAVVSSLGWSLFTRRRRGPIDGPSAPTPQLGAGDRELSPSDSRTPETGRDDLPPTVADPERTERL